MLDTMLLMRQNNQVDATIEHNRSRSEYVTLARNLDTLLANAQPRLARLAILQGVAADAVDDVVQETLVEAWRHLEHLRKPERFDAWLNGICRNVTLRWARTHATASQRQINFSDLHAVQDEMEMADSQELSEPFIVDPTEELARQDLAVLLDRAMSYLLPTAREALELHYLADVPQSETALRLGLPLNALEVRLHRARKQLRQVLSSELRTDAEDFGLVLDQDVGAGWRETRIWCMFCGCHYLQGRFVPQSDGRVDLLMRCSHCDHQWIKSGGMFELCGLKSFRSAFKRMIRAGADYWTAATSHRICYDCNAPVEPRLLGFDESPVWLQPWQGLRLVIECASCGSLRSCYGGSMVWLHPTAQHFITQHPRWINEPETMVEYEQRPALRIRLTDITSAARLTMFLLPETFQVLTAFQE